MPFYEYKCDACGHQFEVLQRMNDEPVQTCEKCSAAVRRIIFPSTIVYKGSGFYSTEYGRSRYNNPEIKKSEPAAAADSGTATASEATSKGSKPDDSRNPSTRNTTDSSSTEPSSPASKANKSASSMNAA